ncbi:3-hydroxybutyrate dehydrogenase [Sphingomonas sp. BIUV-7]|uniref:3-hydroxybutyrate dehydrogenase n=1 Tax=Sphingomonas natans TaxID=3063330 RepID=A0ABT8Y9I9_9SPHN|nr:3-hydroxybutyrate dehydrogenase [Sphingomonas sp. BIUV-7]MDO6415011.1 3-hydroxybutyrate dehydrogenase [Sphingomonas sp. BIUV-7]
MLKGLNAIVTGSTSGIGLGIAHVLASKGTNLVITGFGDAAAIEAERVNLETKHNVKVVYSAADMSKPDEVKAMVELCVSSFGSIDILVNNAGIQFTADVQDFPDEKWHQVIAINLSGIFFAIKAALPHMQAKKFGRIINISSVHGLIGSTHKVAYVAAKHGVIGMSKVVALENAGSGITCNSICPGWVHTPLVQAQIEANAARDGISVEQATENLLIEKQPSKQFATPEQMGELAAFLASDAAAQMTGIALPVDGGWTAQ